MIRVLPAVSEPTLGAVDGFGRRTRGLDPDSGDEVEILELSPALVEHAGFVSALADRVARFAAVRHASYVHLGRLDRPSADRLTLVSDDTGGWRLSQMLAVASSTGLPLDITVVIGLLRQLLPAVALFGRHNRETAIGALAPERLIVTPQGRLVIAEHAFGPALEKLNFGRERLWRDFRVTMAPSAGLPRANPRADAHAIGVVALSLLLGRSLAEDEYPNQLSALVDSAVEHRAGETAPLSKALSSWLTRALQFDISNSFQSPHEVQVAFESVLASDRAYVTSSPALDEWIAKVGAVLDQSRAASTGAPVPALGTSALEASASAHPDSGELRRDEPQAPEAREALSSPALARNPIVLALALFVVVLSSLVAWLWTRDPGRPRAGEGQLVVQSRPVAARVSIDGEERGVTPLTISLPSGAYVLEVQSGKSEPRVIPLTIQAGVQTAQYIELQNVALTGGLDVRSDPPGARVTIDGQSRGTTPVTVRDLAPGDHQVVLEAAGGRKVTQSVRIDAGITAQLVVPLPRR
ncbi:MAG: PEGA domain-containing protein [Acidobacteriota bacterium]|nr:PEGA domain-containing protein [Acidobacteriota bacterium]